MLIKIIDCGSSKVPQIGERLKELNCETEIQKLNEYHFTNEIGIIISGAPILLTESNPENYLISLAKILESNIPILGICFGHQLIGLHFGAKISRCDEDRKNQKINFTSISKLGNELTNEIIFNEDHCECISLPNEFKLIASSSICEVEMMEHEIKNIFGVQFHPETSGKNGKIFFNMFIKYCRTSRE